MSGARTLGRFRVVRRLGTGGLAEVHLAYLEGPAGFRREVAIKRLHSHLRSSPSIVELFLQEACITATLHHPNIVQVQELQEHAGELFMVLEYVDGLDLRQILDLLASRNEVLPSELCLFLAIEIAKALQYAHAVIPPRAGRYPPVIHRDLSPGNVMVSLGGVVKLLDFGVAKMLVGDDAADQVARGKWPYMSPEQVRGEPLDPRSDLFSLGSVLFELITGRQAFAGRTVVESMRRVEQADLPPAPGVDPVLEAILNKLLAREREERYRDAAEALSAMSQVLLLRGWASGERALAEWAVRLRAGPGDDAGEAAFDNDETSLLQNPATPMNTENAAHVVSQGPAATSAITVALHKSSHDAATTVSAEEDPGQEDVTLPPLTGPSDQYGAQGAHRIVLAHTTDEETEVTADRTTNVDGRHQRRRSPSGIRPAKTPVSMTHTPVGAVMPSEPRVFFDHFMPSDEVQEEEIRPGLWTPRNLLVLSMAVLAILIAGLAVLIAVKQQSRQTQGQVSVAGDRPRSRASMASDASLLATTDAGAVGLVPPKPADGQASPPFGMAPPARDKQPENDAAPCPGSPRDAEASPVARPAPETLVGQRPKGRPKKGQLDIITRPPGAQILLDGQLRGQSPLRLGVPPGTKVNVALSVPGRGLYRTPLWMPQGTGRRLNVILPYLSKRFHEAKPGRTAIRVRCRAEGLNRVFFNNLDTGFDCPTPPIAILPVAHSVSVFLSQEQRYRWKQVRPTTGKVTEVVFP